MDLLEARKIETIFNGKYVEKKSVNC